MDHLIIKNLINMLRVYLAEPFSNWSVQGVAIFCRFVFGSSGADSSICYGLAIQNL